MSEPQSSYAPGFAWRETPRPCGILFQFITNGCSRQLDCVATHNYIEQIPGFSSERHTPNDITSFSARFMGFYQQPLDTRHAQLDDLP